MPPIGFYTDTTATRIITMLSARAESIDVDVKTRRGDYPPQMRLQVPTAVQEHYEELLTTDEYPACYRIIPSLSKLMVHRG